jgi:hypothetical protein
MEFGSDHRLAGFDDELTPTASAGAPRESVAAGPGWRVFAADQIEWRQWGDEFVVFNGTTANTHLLGHVAGAVLLELLQATTALTPQQIFRRLFAEVSGQGCAESALAADELQTLETILADFARFRIAGQVAS